MDRMQSLGDTQPSGHSILFSSDKVGRGDGGVTWTSLSSARSTPLHVERAHDGIGT